MGRQRPILPKNSPFYFHKIFPSFHISPKIKSVELYRSSYLTEYYLSNSGKS